MKKLIKFGTLLVALGGALAALSMVDAQANVDAVKKFNADWVKAKTSLEKRRVASSLPDIGGKDLVEAFKTTFGHDHWNVRWEAVVKAALTKDESTVNAIFDEVEDKKGAKNSERAHLIWALANRPAESMNDEQKERLRALLLNNDERVVTTANRVTIARELGEWPLGNKIPHAIGINIEGADRERLEKQNAELMAQAAPTMRANFLALLEVLKQLDKTKLPDDVKDLKKDFDLFHLRWMVVYSMEKLTSQEMGTSVNGWEIWLEQENKGEPFTYRFDTKVEASEVEGLSGRKTDVRTKRRRETEVELILLPEHGKGYEYFYPYMYEFTQDFTVSSFVVPRLKGEPFKDLQGNVQPNMFYYPTQRAADLFEQYRKTIKGGAKYLGFIAQGETACFIAMEFAKNHPETCAFLIILNGFGGSDEVSDAISNLRQNKRGDFEWYAKNHRTYPPVDPSSEEHEHLANVGDISYYFADAKDPQQYYFNSAMQESARNREASSGGDPGNYVSLIDPKYVFEAKRNVKPPTLFLWGTDDPMKQKKAEGRMKQNFERATIVNMKGASRAPWMENPMEFQKLVHTFLEDQKVWDKIENKEKKAKKAAEREAKKNKDRTDAGK